MALLRHCLQEVRSLQASEKDRSKVVFIDALPGLPVDASPPLHKATQAGRPALRPVMPAPRLFYFGIQSEEHLT